MDELRIGTLFTVLLPLLLVAEAVVGVLLWRASGHPMPAFLQNPFGTGVRHLGAEFRAVGIWLAVTAATVWIGFLIAFVGVHILFFTIGSAAALAGLVLSVAILGAVPIVWAFVLFRRRHR
ncbi:MAG TPA: hypothetical protein VNH13_01900 [Candidatus Acidoferrales bacterium]|jgi:hypothetical protein|nr:hypothetical protein [Candidatus Acidoferrales bacterium]